MPLGMRWELRRTGQHCLHAELGNDLRELHEGLEGDGVTKLCFTITATSMVHREPISMHAGWFSACCWLRPASSAPPPPVQ